MKNFIIFIIFFVFAGRCGAQNNDYLVTFDGIGSLKLNMKQAEVEKLLKQKFTMRNALAKAESWMDTVKAKYKNADVTLVFVRQYEKEDSFYMSLNSIRTTSSLFKTKTGIGKGTDKFKIINDYEPLKIELMPEWLDADYGAPSKTRSIVIVNSDAGRNLFIFYLDNKKVTGIEITFNWSAEE